MSSFSGRSLILILLVVIIISLIMLSYRFFAGQADGKKQTVSYAVVGEKEAPAQLIQLFQNNKKREGFARYDKTKRTYLLLNRGEQPTAGYNLRVDEIKIMDNQAEIRITYLDPGPNDLVAQVISYPHIYIKSNKLPDEIIVTVSNRNLRLPQLQ